MFDNNAENWTAVAAFIGVAAAVLAGYIGWRQLRELQRATRSSLRPVMQVREFEVNAVAGATTLFALYFNAENVGPGPALRFSGKAWTTTQDELESVRPQALIDRYRAERREPVKASTIDMGPQQARRLYFYLGSQKAYFEAFVYEFGYVDVFGEPFWIRGSFTN